MIEVINAIEAVVSIPVLPLQSKKKQEQIIYNITPNSDDGLVNQSTLELNIVANTLANAEAYDTAIRLALLNTGDTSQVNGINKITLNGGGTLTSEAGVHRFVNYVITRRSK